MTEPGPPPDPLTDAQLALQLFQIAPAVLGGINLRGFGPARDAFVAQLQSAVTLHRLPPNIDDARLLGGIDLAASLAAGKAVAMPGLLTQAEGAALLAPMAERLSETIAGRLAQARDTGVEAPALVLLDDGIEADQRPPDTLLERVAFHCDLSKADRLPETRCPSPSEVAFSDVALPDDEALAALAGTALALGISSVRPMLFASHAARAHAALQGRMTLNEEDLVVAARLVLAPRALQMPAPEEERDEPDRRTDEFEENQSSNPNSTETPPDDVVLEAALAAIPPDILAALADGKMRRSGAGSAAGKRRKSALRGRPLGARPGMPRGGARLALLDTLRAATPWQTLRRREGNLASKDTVIVRKQDLRIRRFEERAGLVTIFCVDASGSAASARLAEAKGAVELMLAQAHVTRSEVALIAFRGEGAELLLPPTRSLTRARRALSDLPGGGGTPLAAGLSLAHEVASSVLAKGRTALLVVLTDGRGNIALDGTASRSRAAQDGEATAKALARAGLDSLVIDIAPRSGPDAARLAKTMQGRFLALPHADAEKLHAAVSAAKPKAAA